MKPIPIRCCLHQRTNRWGLPSELDDKAIIFEAMSMPHYLNYRTVFIIYEISPVDTDFFFILVFFSSVSTGDIRNGNSPVHECGGNIRRSYPFETQYDSIRKIIIALPIEYLYIIEHIHIMSYNTKNRHLKARSQRWIWGVLVGLKCGLYIIPS